MTVALKKKSKSGRVLGKQWPGSYFWIAMVSSLVAVFAVMGYLTGFWGQALSLSDIEKETLTAGAWDNTETAQTGKIDNSDASQQEEKLGKIIGTIWKLPDKRETIGRVHFTKSQKLLTFTLQSRMNKLELSNHIEEANLDIRAQLDVHRSGIKLTTREQQICSIDKHDKDEVSRCKLSEDGGIDVRRSAPLPRFIFKGNYEVKGDITFLNNGEKVHIGFLEAHLTID